MSYIDQYQSQTITVTPQSSSNRYGQSTFGDPFNTSARLQAEEIVEKDSNTESVRAFAYCDEDINCPIKSKVTVFGIEYFVSAVNRFVDLDGQFMYTKLTINRTYQSVN